MDGEAEVKEQELSSLDERRAELARIFGQEIRMEDPKWLSLMQEGVIVRLHVCRWRMTTRLVLDDLGLSNGEGEAVKDELIQLGEKLLMPAEIVRKLNSLEAQGRMCLARHGFSTYWGVLVPASAYEVWKKENEDLAAQYMGVKQTVVDDLERLRAELAESYEDAARTAYRRAKKLDPASMKRAQVYQEAAYVRKFVKRVLALIPDVNTINTSFSWQAEITYVPLPSLLAQEQAQAENIRADAVQKRAEAGAWAAMNADVLAQARAEKAERIDGFLADVAKQLRSMVFDVCADVLASIKKNDGKLLGRSSTQLKNLCTQVERLNFYGDKDIEDSLNTVKGMLNAGSDVRDAGEIAGALADIATITRSSLLSLGEAPRMPKLVGVAEVPTFEDVRRARRSLKLDAVEIEPVETGERKEREL